MRDTLLVVTAGHIDHGKTSLVRALTGVDLDRLPEERARGITIALGFATWTLPGGRVVSFVDAPGHERFVRTMAAGAHGVDAALLVIAADDGVMPQTREHLAVLELLGVAGGAIVITKTDAVEADLLELVQEEARELVIGTVLQGVPVVPVSALRGTGLDALAQVVADLPKRPQPVHGPFRLSVDRAFVRPGFGTVVTGTAWGGPVREGDPVVVEPGGLAARVRGVQVHGAPVSGAAGGARVALNLGGVSLEQVPRGVVVSVGDLAVTTILDVSLRHLDEEVSLQDGDRITLLTGTAEVPGRVYLAGDAETMARGDVAMAQLRLGAPVACGPGDRLVLRRPSPARTLGGGVVLDPWARRMRRRDRARVAEELTRLAAGDLSVWLARAGDAGLSAGDWAQRGGTGGVPLAGRVLLPEVVARWSARVLGALDKRHATKPLVRGLGRAELQGRLAHLDVRVFDALLDRLEAAGEIAVDGPWVRRAGFAVQLTQDQRAASLAIEAHVRAAGPEGVEEVALLEAVPGPHTAALVRVLEAEGVLLRVPELGWVAQGTLAEVRAALVDWFAAHEAPLSPAAFRDRFGLSRRTTLPWLAWLDRAGWTRRGKDGRTQGEALSPPAQAT